MEDERINVGTKLSHYERHAVRHKPANEMHVAAQPVQFRYSHRAALTARLIKRSGKLRASLKRIGTFACLYLNEYTAQREALCASEALKGFLLGLNTKP
jgi:hypothetical protein